ncbi:MAG TPA: HemK/PrmC family methyltransferase [Actinomycetota bacterium]
MNTAEALDRAVRVLEASEAIDHWQRDRELIEAEDLLCHALGVDELDPDAEIPAAARRRFDRYVDRRALGEPTQLIKGYATFRGLEILIRPGVFVPRDSTEFLAEQAVRRLRRRRRPVHVDVATGGGTVALAVANEVRTARTVGTDISRQAVRVARQNAARLGLAKRATFFVGDLFDALPSSLRGTVDVVTLHPPYVARQEVRDLPEEIRRWEPAHTLTDRSWDGLGLIGRTVEEAGAWLEPGGWLLVEVSPDRSRAVASVLRAAGFRDVRSTMDRGFKVTRVMVARWP